MKIVITGGNGYIGARISRFLSLNGHQIIPLCFPTIPKNKIWRNRMYGLLEGDLRKDETIARIVELNPEAVIHLVSLDQFDSDKEPSLVNDINVLPTWKLLEACTKNNLKKFIYFSTIQVYGTLPNIIINETHPVKTVNTYGLTHLLSEQICDHYNRKTSTNIISVRLSNSYGDPEFEESNNWNLVINDLCRNALKNKEIRLLSDGTPQRDFIHGNDVCNAIKLLINTDEKLSNNIYHISSGNTLTLKELALIIKNEFQNRFGQVLPVITPHGIISEKEPTSQVKKYTISNAKLKVLGFLPAYSIERGVNELFNYLEKKNA